MFTRVISERGALFSFEFLFVVVSRRGAGQIPSGGVSTGLFLKANS
jgi:hypothetical protein